MSKERTHSEKFKLSRRRVLQATLGGAGALVFAPAVRAQASTVKVMQIHALTGPSAGAGIRARDGAIVAVEEINRGGGFTDAAGRKMEIELVTADMANDPKQAVTLYRQAAQDPAFVGSLGPTSSVGFIPLVPVAAQMKLPLINNGAGATIKEWNAYSYRVNPIGSVACPVLIKKVFEVEKFKRLALIVDQTQDGLIADANAARTMAPTLGYELVADVSFRTGDRDFSAQLANIRAAKPDIVWVAAAPSEGPNIVLQIRDAGIELPLITGSGNFQDATYWDGSKGLIKDGYTWLAADMTGAGLRPFVEAYKARFPQEATVNSIWGHTSAMALFAALKKAGSVDREKLQEALSSLDTDTPLGGRVNFKNPPHGDNLAPTVISVKITGRSTYTVV